MTAMLLLPLLLASFFGKARSGATLTIPQAVVQCQPFEYVYSSDVYLRFDFQIVEKGKRKRTEPLLTNSHDSKRASHNELARRRQ
jgi:hypothetical protein